jgi:hypothetical protein
LPRHPLSRTFVGVCARRTRRTNQAIDEKTRLEREKNGWMHRLLTESGDAIAAREPGLFIPESFNGVSGGDLWLFRDFFQMSEPPQELTRNDYVLAGIAFWQDQLDANTPFVRCHGPRSIYENFLPKVREWLRTRNR